MRKMLTYVAIALAVVAVAGGLVLTESTKSTVMSKQPADAIPYNIDAYKNVDPASIGYQEVRQIQPKLAELSGIACGPDDHIYVTGDHQLLTFSNNGAEISRIDIGHKAKCVTLSPDHLVYLGLNNNVWVVDKDGNAVRNWETPSENSVITSIAATENNVFIADASNKVVLHYDPSGTLLNRIGEKNAQTGRVGFIIPSFHFDLAIDDDGYLWVVNPGIHTFENYTFDGQLRSTWRATSFGLDGFSGCCNPTHMAILPDGSFVTSEKGLVRVKIHEKTGSFRTVVAAPRHFEDATVGLDLAADSNGRILVLDPRAGVIRVFSRIDNNS